jgi:TolC family type I secretion outer membrane protein
MAAAILLVPRPGAAETLEDALVRAYTGNPVLLAARARLRGVDEEIAQAISGWLPTISVSSDVGKRRSNTTGGSSSSAGSQNRTPRTSSFTIDQNLFAGLQTVAQTRQAEREIEAERARLMRTEQTVMLDAATAYMDVVRDQAVLKLNINNEKVLRRQLEAARDRFEVGEVTRTDVAQAESRLAGATADRIGSEGALTSSQASYRRQTGVAAGRLKPAAPLTGLPMSEAEAVKLARVNNPTVFAARFDEEAARAAVDVAKADLYPTFDIEGEISRADQTSGRNSRSDRAEITATLKLPLYQAGNVHSKVRQAKQTVAEERGNVEAAIRAAEESATQAWDALQTARARIKAFTAQVRASTIALEGVQQEARVGSRTVLDVLDAEQELLDASVDLARVQRDEVVASFRLRAAVGTLTAGKMNLTAKIYDVNAHYGATRRKFFGIGIKGE